MELEGRQKPQGRSRIVSPRRLSPDAYCYPGGNQNSPLYTNGKGQLWCAFEFLKDTHIPRRWNAFGVYDPEHSSQTITVEINIPTEFHSARIAGFFARDITSGHIYLAHDGSVGGGKAGVGREAFLAWSKLSLVEVSRSEARNRSGVIIGRIDADDLPARIWTFVKQVRDFKVAVRRGDLDSPQTRADIEEWDDFKDESSGRRQGRRGSRIDYISYHGDVVRALFAERFAQRLPDERVLNSRLIDLYVRLGQTLTEAYEVKTDTGRQSIYTAVGQLMTHAYAPGGDVQRILVIPHGDLPQDLQRCLRALGIIIRRFAIRPGHPPEVILS